MSCSGETNISSTVAKDYVDFVLKGNELLREYTFSGTQAAGYTITSTKISYGLPIKISNLEEFAAGISLTYFHGFLFGSLDNAKGTWVTWKDGIEADPGACKAIQRGKRVGF